MTITKIFQVADAFPMVVGIVCLALPFLAALICGLIHGKGKAPPWNYLYSLLAYGACASGLYAAIIPAYILFFTEEKCPDVRLLWFFLPGIIMILTLLQIGRTVSFLSVPGLKRLYLSIPILAISLVVPLHLEKGELIEMPLAKLILLAAPIFFLLQAAAWLLFRVRKVPKAKTPKVPTPQ